MKKLLDTFKVAHLSTFVILCLGTTSYAQNWKGVSFIAPITSITVSNNVQYTNLLTSAASVTGASTTNIVGLIWTNLLGNQVVAAAGDSTALTVDVPLWVDRNGQQLINTSGSNSVWSGAISGLNLLIHSTGGGSGANSPVNLTFAPVFDGAHESTASGDKWTVAFTANTSTQVTLNTNVPTWKWPGCKALRLQTIVNSDTDASSQVTIDAIVLSGFVP